MCKNILICGLGSMGKRRIRILQSLFPDFKICGTDLRADRLVEAQKQQAMEWFNKLSHDDIQQEDTLYNIGVIYYNNSQYDKAVTYFKKATEVNTTFSDAFFQLGMTYTAMDKPKEAVETLKKFMELDPESANFQTAKAIVDAFSTTN